MPIAFNLVNAHRQRILDNGAFLYLAETMGSSVKVGVSHHPLGRSGQVAAGLFFARFIGGAAFDVEQIVLWHHRDHERAEVIGAPARDVLATVHRVVAVLDDLPTEADYQAWPFPERHAWSRRAIVRLHEHFPVPALTPRRTAR